MVQNKKSRAFLSLLLSVLLLFSSAPYSFADEITSGELQPETGISSEAEINTEAENPEETADSVISEESSKTPSEPEAETGEETPDEIISEVVSEEDGDLSDAAGDLAADSASAEAAGASMAEKLYIDISSVVYQAGAIPSKEDLDAFKIGENGYSYSEEDPFAKALTAAAEAYVSGDEISLDIASFALTPTEAAGRTASVINHNPDLYFLAPSVGYTLTEKDTETGKQFVSGLYLVLEADYRVSSNLRSFNSFPRENPDSSSEYKAALDKVVALVKNSWSDTEKALFIHDYLATHIDYTSYAEAGNSRSVYQAYGALVNGKAVCQGYALAFDDIMGKLGIPCYMVSSNYMNHAWNLIQINGKYYHIDCTWDDPTWPNDVVFPNHCEHENFLRSRSGIINTGHKGTDWLLDTESDAYSMNTDTAFDSVPFQSCSAPMAPAGSKWGYLINSKYAGYLYTYDFSTSTNSLVAEINEVWSVYDSNYGYVNTYSGLTSIEYSSKTYFVVNGPTTLYVYDPEGNGTPVNNYGYFIGSDSTEGSIFYYISSDGSNVNYEIYHSPRGTRIKTGSVSYSMLMTGKEATYYKVSISVNNSAYGTVSPIGEGKLEEGTTMTVTAQPKTGYILKHYILNGNTVSASSLTYTIKNISADTTLVAVFEKIGGRKITSITANTSSLLPIYIGETEYLELAPLLTILPADASYTVLKWTSSNENIAVVNGSGTVIPSANGNVVIKATAQDGSGKSVSIPLEIRTRNTSVLIGRSISKTYFDDLTNTNVKSRPGATIQLSTFVMPTTASNKVVCWTSSAPAVASVDGNGKVTVLSAGTADITATCEESGKSGEEIKAKLTIDSTSGEITKILLDQTNAVIADNGTNDRITINATAISSVIATAQAPSLSWSISQNGSHFAFWVNSSMSQTATGESVTVVSTAPLTDADKKKTFTATIKATAQDGGKAYATCRITMKNTISEVKLNCSDVITAESTVQVSRVFTPSNNLYNNTLTYSCENYGEGTTMDRAYINPTTGKLIGYYPGQVLVTAALSDGGSGQVASKIVKIVSPAKNVKLSAFSMEKGASRNLSDVFTYSPYMASMTIKKLEFLNEKPTDRTAAVKTILTNTGTLSAPVLKAEQPGTVSLKLTYETDKAGSTDKLTKTVSATITVTDTGALAPKSITVPASLNLGMNSYTSEVLQKVTTSPLIPGVQLDWKFTDKNGNVLTDQTCKYLTLTPNELSGADNYLRLTAKAAGEGGTTAVVYLRAFHGEKIKSRVMKVSVYPVVTGGLIKKGNLEMTPETSTVINKKSSVSFSGKILGGISAKNLYWESSDLKVFTVTSNGKVTAVNEGDAVLSLFSTESGQEVAKTKIKVVNPLSGITLNTSSVTIPKAGSGSVCVLAYKLADATDKTVSWTCTNASNTGIKDKKTALSSIVLTGTSGSTGVSVTSVTTAAGTPLTFTSSVPGVYTIKATGANNKTATFTVKVIGGVTDLSLRVTGALQKAAAAGSDYTLNLKPGASFTVSPIFTAEYGAVKVCASRSSNTLAATTNKGKITVPKSAIKGSTAIVTIMCVDGIHYRTIKVTVVN